MGEPPGQGSGTLHPSYTNPTSPPVSGIQLDGFFSDSCNAYVSEPALTAKNGNAFIPGWTRPFTAGALCASECHHDGELVIRIPEMWNGHLLTAGTPVPNKPAAWCGSGSADHWVESGVHQLRLLEPDGTGLCLTACRTGAANGSRRYLQLCGSQYGGPGAREAFAFGGELRKYPAQGYAGAR
jgi:hypothetical protein